MSTDQNSQRLEHYLWPEGSKRGAWMIVDSARDKRIFGLMLDCFYSQHSCLFSGPLAPAMEVVAPYLIQLDYDDSKTQRFLKSAWGNGWGVFLRFDGRLEVLRRHLRTFLIVRDEKNNRMMFRYYDPRILRIYLPTCTPAELETVFGPIECFLVEDDSPDAAIDFRFSKNRLVSAKLDLNQG